MCRKIPLDVTMFGQFSISHTVDGKLMTMTDQTSASRRLWAFWGYLIAFRSSPVAQDQLIDVLWNGEETEDPVNTLKTLLHRARRILESIGIEDAKQVLLYRKGSYSWSDQVVFSIDTERFDQHYAAAMEGSPEKLSTLLSAISLYGGVFLPKATQETWATSLRMYYQARFMKICAEAARMLEQEGRYVDMIDVCRKAIHADPYDESIHLLLMQALASNGSQQAAIAHYTYITQLFMDQLGVAPSEQLTSFYRKLVKSTNSVELDLRVVRKALVEEEPANSPYYCEYVIFQDIYRLESRTAERTGQVIQLSMLSILSAQGKSLSAKQAALAMERLKQVISATLRRGDAFTQYSASQYLLLLPCASYENGNKVLQRVVNSFQRAYPTMNVRLQFSVQPLLPSHMEQPALSV
jgi:DNA-binding SARP family transcriptional activator